MTISVAENVAVDIVYNICCADRLFFGVIEILVVYYFSVYVLGTCCCHQTDVIADDIVV
jgi:hypothetical protein